MQTANCWLQIEKFGSDVPVLGMTPAELVLVVNEFQDKLGKFPVHDLEMGDDSDRSGLVEVERLRSKYGFVRSSKPPVFKIDKLYPGVNPRLPETFAETGLLSQAQLNTIAH